MSGFINFDLLDDIRRAFTAGVFEEMGDTSEDEERHVSELERRMIALDEKESYVVIRTLINHHWETFKKTIAYLQKEGENNGRSNRG